MIFIGKKQFPLSENLEEYEGIKEITKLPYDSNDYVKSESFEKDELKSDEKLINNICSSSRAEIPFMTSFVEGVNSQEIINTNGKFILMQGKFSIFPNKFLLFQKIKQF